MSAGIDKSAGIPYFIIDGGQPTCGVAASGSPWLCTPTFADVQAVPKRPSQGFSDRAWRLCPHLDTPGKFIHHYLEYRLFLLADGVLFCHNCRQRSLGGGSVSVAGFRGADRFTDEQLQRYVFDPLYVVNNRLGGHSASVRGPLLSWYVCRHLAGASSLAAHLRADGLILFAENNVACPDCLETALNGSFNAYENDVVMMSDADFQQRVVDTILSVNRRIGSADGADSAAPLC